MVDLVIIGASVRAAAMSAFRAGFRPSCADLFADRDLQAIAPVTRIARSDYPQAFGQALHPRVPWMYTGGLENHPELLDRWATIALLNGNRGQPLHIVRNARQLRGIVHAAGMLMPISNPPPAPSDCEWLVKPKRGSGGIGIRRWQGEAMDASYYLQQFVAGRSVSPQFRGHADHCEFVGLTRQLVGEPWLHAAEFQYCGSIGPLPLDADLCHAWQKLGDALWQLGLRHWFGVDAIVPDSTQPPVIIEVNPRYTASVEVLELGLASMKPKIVGKAIYYAPCEFTFPHSGPWEAALATPFDPWRLPSFADIPHPGERFVPGDPVLTLFVAGDDETSCLSALRAAAIPLESALLV